jgi:hypothetical protein
LKGIIIIGFIPIIIIIIIIITVVMARVDTTILHLRRRGIAVDRQTDKTYGPTGNENEMVGQTLFLLPLHSSYIFESSASTLYLLCSQVATTAPSFSRLMIPVSKQSRRPAWTIWRGKERITESAVAAAATIE